MKWFRDKFKRKNDPDREFKRSMKKVEKDAEILDNSVHFQKAAFAPRNRKPPTRKNVPIKIGSCEDSNLRISEEIKDPHQGQEKDFELMKNGANGIDSKTPIEPQVPSTSLENLSMPDNNVNINKDSSEPVEYENRITITHSTTSTAESEVQIKINEKTATIPETPENTEIIIKQTNFKEKNMFEYQTKTETDNLSEKALKVHNKDDKISSNTFFTPGESVPVITDKSSHRRHNSAKSPLKNSGKKRRSISCCGICAKERDNTNITKYYFENDKLPEIKEKDNKLITTGESENKIILSSNSDNKTKDTQDGKLKNQTMKSYKSDEVKTTKDSKNHSTSCIVKVSENADPSVSSTLPALNTTKVCNLSSSKSMFEFETPKDVSLLNSSTQENLNQREGLDEKSTR